MLLQTMHPLFLLSPRPLQPTEEHRPFSSTFMATLPRPTSPCLYSFRPEMHSHQSNAYAFAHAWFESTNAHAFQVYDGVRHEVLKHVDAFPRAVAALDKHWGV